MKVMLSQTKENVQSNNIYHCHHMYTYHLLYYADHVIIPIMIYNKITYLTKNIKHTTVTFCIKYSKTK